MVSMAWAKTRCYCGLSEGVMPTSFIATGRLIGIYPLKQFAPVIHGTHQLRAALRWAKTLARIWSEDKGE
jgi:hypothetical protein